MYAVNPLHPYPTELLPPPAICTVQSNTGGRGIYTTHTSYTVYTACVTYTLYTTYTTYV